MLRFGRVLVATAIALLLAVPSASATQEQLVRSSAPATPVATFSPDRVIVEWVAGASPAERRVAREEADVGFSRDLGTRRFQLVETEAGQTPGEAVRELEADPAVLLAERDAYAAELAIPDDPLFGQLWGLQNTGLGINGFTGALAGADIGAVGAWDQTIGTPTTIVADIDGGYRFEHPDLADVAWNNPGETLDGVDNDGNGIVDDVHGADLIGANAMTPTVDGDPTDDDPRSRGHGIHTAGTIGAEGNNGIGIVGVAQGVSIMPLRVCAPLGESDERPCPYSAMIEAIEYAGAHGARVANMSIGGPVARPTVADAIAANPQTLFVIAAGNEAESNETAPTYPCVFNPLAEGKSTVDNVICVAATDQADRRADFSNWGVNTVDLGAPGTQTLSAAPYRYVVKDDFEVDDFALKWTPSGAAGGFVRTNESPLDSYGITDSPGATPVPGLERASTSVPVTLAPGYKSCSIDLVVPSSTGGTIGILLDGEEESFGIGKPGRISHNLLEDLSAGGEVAVRVSYKAGPTPGPNSGLWIEDIDLHCVAKAGEADGYRFAEGTSMATPHVTGAAALIFSMKPSASVTEVRQALLGSVDPVSTLAGKTTSGGRLDIAAALDLFDAVPPPTPTLSTTNPHSPSKNNQPRLIGSAQPGTSVDVYANATCSGSPVAGGTAAKLVAPGIAVTVGDDSSTQFSIKATDLATHTSPCSAPISYTEDSQAAPPLLVSTDPASPGASGTPRILGTAEAGSVVKIYAGPACAGSPVATGTAAALGSPGITVQVAEGVTAVFSATATDPSANTSACSGPISYTRPATTDAGGGGGGTTTGSGGGDVNPPPPPPPPPTPCVVPKLAGKTLAQARTALQAAACKLGTVRKPRPRKGRRPPLVVKSSTPAPGASPGDGEVDLTLAPKPRKARR